MSTSTRTTNYSEAHEKQSKRFNPNSFNKSNRQTYVIAGTTRQNETQLSDGRPYRELDSPSRAKVVTMEFENVSDAVRINNSTSSLERSSNLPKRTYGLRQQIPTAKSDATTEKFASSYRSTVNRNELEDSRRDDRQRDKNLPDEGSGYVNSSISAASSSGDKSSRAKPIDRNHRSVTSTSSLGAVTATKTEVPSRLTTLREDFAANKRSSSAAEQDSKEVSENRGSHRFSESSQSKPGRRRRRAFPSANEHSEPTTNRSNFPRNSTSNDSEKSKSSVSSNRKFSPYPNYIQPVAEGPSYRREVNRILSHDTGSSPYSHRNRKISTDMNRYVSSSSKSSSSESDEETIPRTVALSRSKNLSRISKEVATPDTSDGESKIGVRLRRGSRKSVRMQPTSSWDDPYAISLPDNFKQPEEFASLKSPRSNGSDSNSRHNLQIHNDRNIPSTIESSREIRSAKNSSKEISDSAEYRGRNRRGNRLNINKAGVERNVEGLGSSLSPSRNADVSLSTPDLARVDRQTSGSNDISTSGVYRKPSESGESENYDIASPISQSNDVVHVNSSIEKVDYEVIQQQPKITARKVGQHFWPRDEDTERLLTHTKATSNRSQSPEATTVGSHSAASYAMQETIEQLQSFVNETDRHRPLASDRSKSLETVSGRASPSYAGLRRGSNKFSAIHGQQSSKTSSPHMSSTETLKEAGSLGEYQDQTSRSPSFDSTISNPEFPIGINSRITQRPGKERTQKAENLGRSQSKSVSADDLSLPLRDGTTTLKKLHDLTEAMKNIKMPQPSNSQSITPTDTISTVSSSNSVSNSQNKLETLNEYPEPLPPAIHKRSGSKKRKGVVRTEFQSGDSLEIDEGVVTDEVHPEDTTPFQEFDQYLGKPPKRNTHHIQSIDQNDINEQRSRSDPSAERKRVPSSHKTIDHGILGALRNPRDYGSSGQSIGGSSQNSEQQSLFSDTLNIDELIREEQEDELKKLQSKERMKKKSKSDPNPEGLITLDTEPVDKDNGYKYNTSLGPASSEPNVLEQTDILGPLNRFPQHPTGPEALNVRVAPCVRRYRRNISLSKDGISPTSRQSLSSSQESESSSPVQKQEEEIAGMFQKSAEEFDIVFENMKNDDKQNVKEAVAHTRSSSLPVDNVDYTQHPRYTQSSPYGGSTFNLPKPNARRNTDEQVFAKENFAPDKRLHVFENLLDTEKSYVSSLRILCQDYMMPLKYPEHQLTCEPRLVDEIFYKIPQLLEHHEKFYDNVKKCHDDWNTREIKLGELFLNSFNKDALLDTYTAYTTNFFNAREAVRTANGKESFRRFLEHCRSKDKDKYSLADLLIKPVQRIPRYELLIKDMLKHTSSGHPDRDGLVLAQKEIHKLADQMNRSEKEAERAEKQDRLLNEVEQLIEGCVDLCIPKRRFLRQDIVAEISSGSGKKDRSLWLFNDLLVCSTRKAKAGNTFRRGSINNLNFGQDRPPSIDPSFKYKFLWKFPLEDVDKWNDTSRANAAQQLQSLQSDLDHLKNIQQTAAKIETFHPQLDDVVRDIMLNVERQLLDKKQTQVPRNSPPGRLELCVSTTEGMKLFVFDFTFEDKVQFDKLFGSAKRSLTSFKSRWEPTFMKAIPITKERSGMQFSCAAANVDGPPDCKEVWVCNTDGSVGQVCILALGPMPNLSRCITVCDARIYCIAQVPIAEKKMVPAHVLLSEMATGTIAQPSGPAQAIMSWDDEVESDEDSNSPHGTLSNYSSPHSQSPSHTVNGGDDYYPTMSPLIDSPFLRRRFGFGRLDRQLAASQPVIYHPLHEKSDHSNYSDFAFRKDDTSSMDCAFRKNEHGLLLHGSLNDLLQDGENNSLQGESNMSSELIAGMDAMWLGSDDGMIHIFPSSQSMRTNKNCVKRSLNAPVYNILYHNAQVFVSLSNGELLVYSRDTTTGQWDLDNYKTKPEKSPRAITKMVVVGGKELWCGCQNMIKIIDIKDLSDIGSFTVSNDPKKQVFCMVSHGYGVWIALDKRPQIKLYHSTSHELLADVDVSSPVSKMLASADAIIRQHKAACLRITALLVCNGLLWLGTSAGVVLTVTLPKIIPHTSALAMPVIPQGLAYGHTGHVRFLACAEIPEKDPASLSRGNSRRVSANKRRPSSSNAINQPKTVSYVISGGDGYEDFRMNSDSESAGREDSINHLLVWKA